MTINVSYPEISTALKTYTGREISFLYQNGNTILAEFTAEVNVPLLGRVQKKISFDITIISFADEVVTFSLDAGGLANTAIKYFSSILLPLIPIKVAMVDERTFSLQLMDVEQLRPLLEKLSISGVRFSPDSVSMDAHLK